MNSNSLTRFLSLSIPSSKPLLSYKYMFLGIIKIILYIQQALLKEQISTYLAKNTVMSKCF